MLKERLRWCVCAEGKVKVVCMCGCGRKGLICAVCI